MARHFMQWIIDPADANCVSDGRSTHRLGVKWAEVLAQGDEVVMEHIAPKPAPLEVHHAEVLRVERVIVGEHREMCEEFWRTNHARPVDADALDLSIQSAYKFQQDSVDPRAAVTVVVFD